MTVNKGWVQQVKAVVADIQRARPHTAEARATRDFHRYQAHTRLPVLVQTPRARAEREIERIALTYGWQIAVSRALDAAGAVSVECLDDSQVDQLLERMRAYVDQAMTACDCEEAPPAR